MASAFALKDLSGTTLFDVDDSGNVTMTGNAVIGNAATDTLAINADLTTGLKWDAGTYTYALDLSAMTTGQADVVIGDNLASALAVRESSTDYLVVSTTNNGERVNSVKPLTVGAEPQVIDMADAAVTLVWGAAAGAGEVLVTSNMLIVDPNSGGAGEDLGLSESLPSGLMLFIQNTGGENIVVKSSGGSTLGTIATGKAGAVVTNGSGGGIVIVGA